MANGISVSGTKARHRNRVAISWAGFVVTMALMRASISHEYSSGRSWWTNVNHPERGSVAWMVIAAPFLPPAHILGRNDRRCSWHVHTGMTGGWRVPPHTASNSDPSRRPQDLTGRLGTIDSWLNASLDPLNLGVKLAHARLLKNCANCCRISGCSRRNACR